MMLAPATPELPVRDVRATQAWYRDRLGFEIAWYNEDGRIGAVAHGDCALFFRQTEDAIPSHVTWIFADDIEAFHDHAKRAGAEITDPLGETSWGLRQFTIRDPDGHLIHVHHDL